MNFNGYNLICDSHFNFVLGCVFILQNKIRSSSSYLLLFATVTRSITSSIVLKLFTGVCWHDGHSIHVCTNTRNKPCFVNFRYGGVFGMGIICSCWYLFYLEGTSGMRMGNFISKNSLGTLFLEKSPFILFEESCASSGLLQRHCPFNCHGS